MQQFFLKEVVVGSLRCDIGPISPKIPLGIHLNPPSYIYVLRMICIERTGIILHWYHNMEMEKTKVVAIIR